MPVRGSVRPKDVEDLNKKLLAANDDSSILKAVQDHFRINGNASLYSTTKDVKDVKDVNITERCIVFLLRGSFKVGGEEVSQEGEGHFVENESIVDLQGDSAIVTIY